MKINILQHKLKTVFAIFSVIIIIIAMINFPLMLVSSERVHEIKVAIMVQRRSYINTDILDFNGINYEFIDLTTEKITAENLKNRGFTCMLIAGDSLFTLDVSIQNILEIIKAAKEYGIGIIGAIKAGELGNEKGIALTKTIWKLDSAEYSRYNKNTTIHILSSPIFLKNKSLEIYGDTLISKVFWKGTNGSFVIAKSSCGDIWALSSEVGKSRNVYFPGSLNILKNPLLASLLIRSIYYVSMGNKPFLVIKTHKPFMGIIIERGNLASNVSEALADLSDLAGFFASQRVTTSVGIDRGLNDYLQSPHNAYNEFYWVLDQNLYDQSRGTELSVSDIEGLIKEKFGNVDIKGFGVKVHYDAMFGSNLYFALQKMNMTYLSISRGPSPDHFEEQMYRDRLRYAFTWSDENFTTNLRDGKIFLWNSNLEGYVPKGEKIYTVLNKLKSEIKLLREGGYPPILKIDLSKADLGKTIELYKALLPWIQEEKIPVVKVSKICNYYARNEKTNMNLFIMRKYLTNEKFLNIKVEENSETFIGTSELALRVNIPEGAYIKKINIEGEKKGEVIKYIFSSDNEGLYLDLEINFLRNASFNIYYQQDVLRSKGNITFNNFTIHESTSTNGDMGFTRKPFKGDIKDLKITIESLETNLKNNIFLESVEVSNKKITELSEESLYPGRSLSVDLPEVNNTVFHLSAWVPENLTYIHDETLDPDTGFKEVVDVQRVFLSRYNDVRLNVVKHGRERRYIWVDLKAGPEGLPFGGWITLLDGALLNNTINEIDLNELCRKITGISIHRLTAWHFRFWTEAIGKNFTLRVTMTDEKREPAPTSYAAWLHIQHRRQALYSVTISGVAEVDLPSVMFLNSSLENYYVKLMNSYPFPAHEVELSIKDNVVRNIADVYHYIDHKNKDRLRYEKSDGWTTVCVTDVDRSSDLIIEISVEKYNKIFKTFTDKLI